MLEKKPKKNVPLKLSQIDKFVCVTKTLILHNKWRKCKICNTKFWKNSKDCSRQFNFCRTIFTVTKFWTTIEKKNNNFTFWAQNLFCFLRTVISNYNRSLPFLFFLLQPKRKLLSLPPFIIVIDLKKNLSSVKWSTLYGWKTKGQCGAHTWVFNYNTVLSLDLFRC